MDGAARFNQRDALATILITAINIIAGLLIGVIQQGIDISTAVRTYTILTVGDGLVTMIPSLLVSIAGGLVLTRASGAETLDKELNLQLFSRRNVMYLTAGVLAVMSIIPGMPKLPFLLVATGVFLFGRTLPADGMQTSDDTADAIKMDGAGVSPAGEDLAGLLKVDDLTLEIGFQLIPLVDEQQNGQMLNRVRALRRHLATELGFIVPPVHITDNLRLRPREYVVQLRGNEIGRWQTEGNCMLAVNSDPKARVIPGVETREPAFGVAARWIDPGLQEQALAAGYSVVDQTAVIGTHLAELIRRNAHELLGRAETKRLLDSVNESHPKLMEELLPKLMTLGEIQKVLQQLLREQVSIRSLGIILETLVECAPHSKDVVFLTEQIRQHFGRNIVRSLLDPEGGLNVLTLEPSLEQQILRTFDPEGAARMQNSAMPLGKNFLRPLLDSVRRLTGDATPMALPVLLCPSPARYHLRRWLEPFLPKVTVLAPSEIPPEVRVRSVGVVGQQLQASNS